MIGLKVDYKHKLRVSLRWDRFAIPLLFNKIRVQFMDVGKISASDLRNMREKNREILRLLIPKEYSSEEVVLWNVADVKE